MTQKIAVINDLSGFGRCSLTAALPVIASMGVQPCPLPTAVLSAQTGYPSYYLDDYTDKMKKIYGEWEKMGVQFDGVYTGFLADERQISQVSRFLDRFYDEKTFLLADPVMGDNGARFPIFSEKFQHAMKELVSRADIITPNLTELCLLTGADCRMAGVGNGDHSASGTAGNRQSLIREAGQMARELMAAGPSEIVVTGIRFIDENTGEEMMGNLAVTREGEEFSSMRFIGESYSGTGDLFASVIAGGKARGESLGESVKLAETFIGAAIKDAVEAKVPRNEGVEFERHLWMLSQVKRKY